MKKQLIGAMMLVAALIITGCSNNNSAQKNVKNQKEKEEVKENRMLIIVDPQIDFTTGSLATAKGPEAISTTVCWTNTLGSSSPKTPIPPTTARLLSKVACSLPTVFRALKA